MLGKPELIILDNGIKALLLHSNDSYSATISVYSKYGSAVEDPSVAGITHLIEHVALTRTKKWPNAADLSFELEENGANKNGYTTREEVKYYVNVPYTKIDFGMDVIFEITFNATFSEESIKQQKKIIYDEIAKYQDDIADLNYNYVINSVIKSKSGYAKHITGSQKTLGKLTRDQIYQYYQAINSPQNLLFSCAGRFDKKDVLAKLRKYEKIKPHKNNISFPVDGFSPKKVFTKYSKKTNLAHTNIITRLKASKDYTSRDLEILRLFTAILCGPTTSRLHFRLREIEHLLYSIDLDVNVFKTFGFLVIGYELPPSNFDKALSITIAEMKHLRDNGVKESELSRFKEYITNRRLVYYDNIHNLIKLHEAQVLDDRKIISLEEHNRYLMSINLNEINNFIKDNGLLDSPFLCVYGNINDKNSKYINGLKEL